MESDDCPTLMRLLSVALLAGVGGWLATSLGLPLAWLIGATLVTAGVSLSGLPVLVPQGLYRAGQVVVGVAVGLTVTSDIVSRIGLHAYLAPVAALTSLMLGRLLVPAFARLGGLDRTTAHFSLVPAGISEMSDLAGRYGGDVGAVATLHALRVMLIVLILPLVIYSFNPVELARTEISRTTASDGAWTAGLAVALSVGLLAAWLGSKAGLPSAYVVAPMVIIALLSGSAVLRGEVPSLLLATAQVVLGLSLGARFKKVTVRRLPRALAAGAPVLLSHAGIMGLLALGLAVLFDFSPTAMILGLATGGTAEMVLTAQTVGDDAALVAAYQVTRGLLGNALAGLIFKKTGVVRARLRKDTE